MTLEQRVASLEVQAVKLENDIRDLEEILGATLGALHRVSEAHLRTSGNLVDLIKTIATVAPLGVPE
jgi:uncharacterized coiled-coil protein SlyX